jgi:hypothetical protein
MMLEATIYRALPRVPVTAIRFDPSDEQHVPQVVSVTRDDAAKPDITDFWRGNTGYATVPSANLAVG